MNLDPEILEEKIKENNCIKLLNDISFKARSVKIVNGKFQCALDDNITLSADEVAALQYYRHKYLPQLPVRIENTMSKLEANNTATCGEIKELISVFIKIMDD